MLLRAVSREAGVSHNAAYRHFANQEDLLAAVAERCMTQLGLADDRAHGTGPARGPVRRAQARLEAIGRAYIDFARDRAGLVPHGVQLRSRPSRGRADSRTVRPRAVPTRPPALTYCSSARLDELVAVGALTPQRRPGAEYAAWSAVHGLSSLLLDGPLRDLPEPEVEHAIVAVLSVVRRGLE